MIALDTNVLVRLFTADDREQAARVVRLLDGLTKRRERAYVPDVVLCELVWVLERGYGHTRDEVTTALRAVLAAEQLALDAPERVVRATDAYRRGRGDFADYLIREQAKAKGCAHVATFDRKLLREAMFTAP